MKIKGNLTSACAVVENSHYIANLSSNCIYYIKLTLLFKNPGSVCISPFKLAIISFFISYYTYVLVCCIYIVYIKIQLFQLNIRHKDATVSQLATTVVYEIYWPLGAIQCSRKYKKFLKSISIHFNSSFMQLKQQTSDHKNIPLFCSPSSMVMLPR